MKAKPFEGVDNPVQAPPVDQADPTRPERAGPRRGRPARRGKAPARTEVVSNLVAPAQVPTAQRSAAVRALAGELGALAAELWYEGKLELTADDSTDDEG